MGLRYGLLTIDCPWYWREGDPGVPSFSPMCPPLTRGVRGLQRGPPRVCSSAGEFAIGGAWCPGICNGGSSRQRWGPAPGLGRGKSRRQIPRLASGQSMSRRNWRPGVCRRSPGRATWLSVRPETCRGEGDSTDTIPTLPHPLSRALLICPAQVGWWYPLHKWGANLGASGTLKSMFNK